MDEIRFVNSKENPRPLDRVLMNNNNNNNNNGKILANELSQKQQPLALERFRAMLKDRDDELRVSDEDDVPPPSTEEIVRLYELLLSELTFNSKPIITDLTIIAGEQREHGDGIADAICARIIEVPVEQKLPSLYLLDSIVKNIGREYIRHFSSRLPEVFCEAYRQVNPNLYPSMRHLFGTWSAVFPQSVLRKIESQLQFSPAANTQSSGLTPLRASESPRPAHGIHVNPKYLEARRQFDNSNADNNIQHARGTSSNIKLYGQKQSGRYGEYDLDHDEVPSSKVGAQRSGFTDSGDHTSLGLRTNKLLPSSNARLATQPSPLRNGLERSLIPGGDELVADNSSRWFAERDSPSHPGYDYGLGVGRDEETSSWRRKHSSDDSYQQFETPPVYSLSNGFEHQRPKALIDAYGSDKRISNNNSWRDKPLKVERLSINGIDSKMATKSWQNTEEVEYDWEDMSPTLADRGRTNDFLPSSIPPIGGFRRTSDYGTPSTASFEPNFRKSNWSSRAQPPMLDSSTIAENAVPTIGFGRGPAIPGFQNERNQILGSHYPQEAWSLPHHLPQSSDLLLNAKGRGRNIQMPFPASGTTSSVGNLPDTDAQPSIVLSRMGSSGLSTVNVEARSAGVPASSGVWPPVNMHSSQPFPALPQHKQIGSQFNMINPSEAVMNQGPNTSLPNQQGGLIHLNRQNQAQVTPLQPQYPSQEVRGNLFPATAALGSSHSFVPPFNHGYIPQGRGAASNMAMSNPVPGVYWPMPVHNIPNSSLHIQGGSIPPLPPGPPPVSSQMMPIPQNAGSIVSNQPTGGAFSGLIGSLMAQGLISLTKEAPVEDSVGLDFNADVLKVRHESAIKALYGDLPRQCTTCGLRFKCQEEHSTHMDWHVTKNRINKNRKQKPSRKWFVSDSMWLSGAEALGTDAVPGFLPTETTVEKKDDEEMAVPADEDQNVCALCGEPFDDFYSDDTEEWMYRGAVYLNAPNGSTAELDGSQLGPIVHAKCRSETNVVPPEDQDEGGNNEEGSQRKRMRVSLS